MQHTATTATLSRTIALAIALFAGSAQAGTVLTTETRTGKTVHVNEMRVQGGNLRADTNDADERRSVILTDKTMYVLDHNDRTYAVMDEATMRRLGGQMAQARQQMEAQMAKLPPEQRAMMQRAMAGMQGQGAAQAPRTEYRRTARGEAAAGIACKVWEGYEAGKKTEEVCVAAASSIPGGAEMLAGMKKMGERMSKIMQSMGGSGIAVQQMWNELSTLNGVPIIQRDFEGGRVTSTSTLKAALSETVPAASFAPPAGYKPRKLDGQ